jgi:hypothetical protein
MRASIKVADRCFHVMRPGFIGPPSWKQQISAVKAAAKRTTDEEAKAELLAVSMYLYIFHPPHYR